jgi:hypothetical protein
LVAESWPLLFMEDSVREKQQEMRRRRKRRDEAVKSRRKAAMAGKPIAMPTKSVRKTETPAPAEPVAVTVEPELAAIATPAAGEPTPPTN